MHADAGQIHSSNAVRNFYRGSTIDPLFGQSNRRDKLQRELEAARIVASSRGLDLLCSALQTLCLESSLERCELLRQLEVKWNDRTGNAAVFYLSFLPTLTGMAAIRILYSVLNASRKLIHS